jgi:hypothetical protein
MNEWNEDNCAYFPCRNGGTCNNTGPLTYECICPNGFIGQQCEFVDPCVTYSPCQNGATCVSSIVNSNGTYFCSCPGLYYGVNCTKVFGPSGELKSQQTPKNLQNSIHSYSCSFRFVLFQCFSIDCYNKDRNCTTISSSECILDVTVRGVPIREACTALCTSCTRKKAILISIKMSRLRNKKKCFNFIISLIKPQQLVQPHQQQVRK